MSFGPIVKGNSRQLSVWQCLNMLKQKLVTFLQMAILDVVHQLFKGSHVGPIEPAVFDDNIGVQGAYVSSNKAAHSLRPRAVIQAIDSGS